jgi:hypothetical protein
MDSSWSDIVDCGDRGDRGDGCGDNVRRRRGGDMGECTSLSGLNGGASGEPGGVAARSMATPSPAPSPSPVPNSLSGGSCFQRVADTGVAMRSAPPSSWSSRALRAPPPPARWGVAGSGVV